MQVVSGQLEGTMFDLEAAKRIADDSKGKPPLPEKLAAPVSPSKPSSGPREAALAARNASRVLQSLPSQVGFWPAG